MMRYNRGYVERLVGAGMVASGFAAALLIRRAGLPYGPLPPVPKTLGPRI